MTRDKVETWSHSMKDMTQSKKPSDWGRWQRHINLILGSKNLTDFITEKEAKKRMTSYRYALSATTTEDGKEKKLAKEVKNYEMKRT